MRSIQSPFSNLVDLDDVAASASPSGEIAIHIHIFYFDLLEKTLEYIKNIPFKFDLFINSPYDIDRNVIKNIVNGRGII